MQPSHEPAPPVAAIVPPAPVEPPAPTIAPPVPVVVLAFHQVQATGKAAVFDPEQPPPVSVVKWEGGLERVAALEVEIVAEACHKLFRKRDPSRLFVGTILEAKGWLDERGYQYVLGSNARWAA